MKKLLYSLFFILLAACASSVANVDYKGKIDEDKKIMFLMNQPYGEDILTAKADNSYGSYNSQSSATIGVYNPMKILVNGIQNRMLVDGWLCTFDPELAKYTKYRLAISADINSLFAFWKILGFDYEISVIDNETNKTIIFASGTDTPENIAKNLAYYLRKATK